MITTHPNGAVYASIYEEVRDLYKNAVDAQRWMLSGHPQLGGRSPLQLIRKGRADEVRRLVTQLQAN